MSLLNCRCSQLGDFVAVCVDDATFDAFTLVDDRIGAELRLCPDCGTRWQIDNDRSNLAIRVPATIEWPAFDDRPFRLAHMIKHHSGLSDSICIWAGCSHKCLNGKAICVHHAYPSLSNEVETET